LFERLLAAYPKEHRRAYGHPMAQLFRNQCRDAWVAARGWGLAGLWLRVLPDLVKTSVLEHISTLNERKTMLERISMLLRPRSAPWFIFIAVFAAVFLFVVAASTLITFLLPESYCSTARVLVRQEASESSHKLDAGMPLGPYDPYFLNTQMELMRSQLVLDKVVNDLDLRASWGRKYPASRGFRLEDVRMLLQSRIALRPVRNTSLLEIRAFSDQAAEAAQLANAIADSYREYRSHIAPADIVDQAVPGLRPVRPNKPLNIFLSVIGGALLATAAGAIMAGLAAWIGRRSGGTGAATGGGAVPPSQPPQPDHRLARSALDQVTGILWIAVGGLLFGVALFFLVWFLTLRQADVTAELLALPLFGLFWGGNAFLGVFLYRGKRWARICLGLEGVLLLTYYYFRHAFPIPHCLAWVSTLILQLGMLTVGPLPYIFRWVFIPLALASLCACLWPRKTAANIAC
jgi:capsular polysaccharide biosynthesis protein